MTKDEQYQGVIGQRRDMSPWDVLELNRRYKCSKYLEFKYLLYVMGLFV